MGKILFILGLLILPAVVLAACPSDAICIENPLSADDFQELIDNIIDLLATFAFVVAPVLIVYSGFLFLTSGGNPEKIWQAKNLLIWAVVGFGLILLAKGLVLLLEQILGVT